MKRLLLSVAACFLLAPHSALPQKPPPFLAASDARGVHLLLVDVPADMEGFTVQRKSRDEAEYVSLTPEPVTADDNPASARLTLGEDYPWVARALRAQDEFEVLRRLKSDRGVSSALSLASARVARVAGRSFVDESAAQGKTYRYRIALLDYAGKNIATHDWELSAAPRQAAPPSKVDCEAGDAEVRIAWEYPSHSGKPDDIVVGFHIYRRSGRGEFMRLTATPILRQSRALYRSDLQVENGREYTYHVRAVDFLGRESDASASASAVPVDRTPPGFPENLQALAEEGRVLLIWKMNPEQDLSHYDVYRSGNMHDGYEKISRERIPGDRARFEDTSVIAGPLYYYKVRAVDRAGNESEFSDPAVGHPLDTTPPSPPDNLTAAVANRRVRLRWNAPGDKDLRGFYIYQQVFDGSFMRIHPEVIPKNAPMYEDAGFTRTGVPVGKTYVYGVTAVDNSWLESPRAEVRVAVPDDEPPEPPVDWYLHLLRDGSVRIGWQPSSSLDVRAYRIYRAEEGGKFLLLREISDGAFAASDAAPIMGRRYAYQVAAVDSSGNESARSAPKEIVPRDLAAPDAPAEVRATVSGKTVTVAWSPVSAADLVGYNVYRSELPNTAETKLNRTPLLETRFVDPRGKAGKYYRVSALDSSGHENREGAPVEAR